MNKKTEEKTEEKVTKKKTIHNLEMHEIIEVTEDPGNVSVMRVEGGWIYMLDFPGWRQTNTIFVPYSDGAGRPKIG